jgi:3-methylfumaryl-CoA hydratase
MWAGSRLEFHNPLRIGEAIARTSRILDVTHKEGRSGPLVFVVVRHEISNPAGVAITEEHDIVYREPPSPDAPKPEPPPAPSGAVWERTIQPDDVLLFRYSAVTFNAHRIHFDRRYSTDVEHYPGLVVHGPLIATLLLDLLRRSLPGAQVKRFVFRAVSPLFDTAPFSVCGRPEGDTVRLWARSSTGALAMDSTATL